MQFIGTELCDFCFEPLCENEQCRKCGFTEDNYKYLYNKVLTPGTVLLGRYIIGRVLEKDVTRVSYLALAADRKKTVINEYLPSRYVSRAYGEQIVTVDPEYKESFFSGAADFTSSDDHERIGEPFFANGTVYFESRYTEDTCPVQDIFAEETNRKDIEASEKTCPHERQTDAVKHGDIPEISEDQAGYTAADGVVDEKIFLPEAPEHLPERTAHPFIDPTEEISADVRNMTSPNNDTANSGSRHGGHPEREVYVSRETMSRFHSEPISDRKKKKNWFFPVFVALGAAVCAVLLTLIILNL